MERDKFKILLAEDDLNLGDILNEYLELKGYKVQMCRDGVEALQAFKRGEFDLCIFDVMMPAMDGFTLAQEIRKFNKQIPIIFLTAKSAKDDKIHGLEIGADDYLTKPFSMEELLLRIRAILRRTANMETTTAPATLKKFDIGSLHFDYDAQLLKSPDKEYRLTSKEAELLRMLCEHKNQTLERSKALIEIWHDDTYFNARSMDVYITKLRKYLQSDERLKIINVHGTGFKLVELVEG
jgi:DNA-binding response OmpR family regulator